MNGMPTETQFIYYGLQKHGWLASLEYVDKILYEDSTPLDLEDDAFVNDFWRYYEWYWRDKKR